MNQAYDKLSEVIKSLGEEGEELENIIGALHIMQLHCETTLRLKLVQRLTDDTE